MLKIIRKHAGKAGLAPGTLVHVGEKKADHVRIQVIDYDQENFEEREVQSIDECVDYRDRPTVTWINIDGLHDVEVMEQIGRTFNLHPLVLEDIMSTDQRPKMEDYENYIFIICKMLSYNDQEDRLNIEQFSLLLLPNVIISFQEKTGDVFNPVRERMRKGKGRIRRMGMDYLMYALLDAVVDNYFIVLENIGERIEDLEE
jgi:magnesium transporter